MRRIKKLLSKKLNTNKEFEMALGLVVGPAANSNQNTKSSSQKQIQKDDYDNTIPDCDDNYDSVLTEQTLAKYDKRDLQSQPISKTGNKNLVKSIGKNHVNISRNAGHELPKMKQMKLDSYFQS
jgi:hypothetical protein